MKVQLDQLQSHPDNVRNVNVDNEIVELAANIKANGLIQPLVCTITDQPEIFFVAAGHRRLAALQHLVANGNPIEDVEIIITDKDPVLISLSENLMRVPMRPVDQFKAFDQLHKRGVPRIDIAEAFSVTVAMINKRMRLGQLAPEVLARLDADDVNLDYAMALTLCKTKKQQLEMMRQYPNSYYARDIKRALIEGKFPMASAAFDHALYKGGIVTDMFPDFNRSSDDDQEPREYFTDFDKALKLQIAEGDKMLTTLSEEGWKWSVFSPTQRAEVIIDNEYTRVFDKYEENGDFHQFTAEEMAQSGVYVCFDNDWSLYFFRGLMTTEEYKNYKYLERKKASDEPPSEDEEATVKRGNPDTYPQLLNTDLFELRRTAIGSQIIEDVDKAMSIALADMMCVGYAVSGVRSNSGNALMFPQRPREVTGDDRSGNPWVHWELRKIVSNYDQLALKIYDKIGINEDNRGDWIGIFNAICGLTRPERLTLFALFVAQGYHLRTGDLREVFTDMYPVDLRAHWKPEYAFWLRFNKPQMAYIMEDLQFTDKMIENMMKRKADDCRSMLESCFNDPKGFLKQGAWLVGKTKDQNAFIKAVETWVPPLWNPPI